MPWCGGGDFATWLSATSPQHTVTDACLLLHDILRVRDCVVLKG